MCLAMCGAFKRRPRIGRHSYPRARFPNSFEKAGEIERHRGRADRWTIREEFQKQQRGAVEIRAPTRSRQSCGLGLIWAP